jgi:putative protease
MNYAAVQFWKDMGVKRIVFARELNIEEIKEIREKVPGMEIEVFVHGAMCMSYS